MVEVHQKYRIIVDGSKFPKTSVENFILTSSLNYLCETNTLDAFMKIVNRDPEAISIRKLEEAVMKVAKEQETFYLLKSEDGKKPQKYYIYREYQKRISDYKKQNFCFFRRENDRKLTIRVEDLKKNVLCQAETTPGQINLAHWLFRDRVIDYILDNYEKMFGCPLPKGLEPFKKYLGEETLRD